MQKNIFSYLAKNQAIAGLFIIGLALTVYHLREILIVIFISYIIVASLNPVVLFLRRRRVPKTIAVILTFFSTLIFVVLLIAPLIPFFVLQVQQLAKSFPSYLQQAASAIGVSLDTREIGKIITPQQLGQNAFAFAGGVFGGFFTIVSTIAISFYLLLSYDTAKESISMLFPKRFREKTSATVEQVNDKLGAWLQGQFILSLTIGLLTWLSLTSLQMPFALPLAVLAGLFEIVPTVGPIIASVPAIIVALTISPNMALIIVGLYIMIQLVENHVLVPRIMQRAVGLNPVIVIIGVIVGDRLLGIPGALLSVPFISLVVLILKNTEQSEDQELSHIKSAS